MERMTSPTLTKILTANRERLNAFFETNRLKNPALDPDFILKFFCEKAESFILLYTGRDDAVIERIVLSLYEFIVILCSKEMLGPACRYPGFSDSLFSLIARFPGLISEGQAFFNPLANAMFTIGHSMPQRLSKWIECMGSLTGEISDIGLFKKCGLALAWTIGMAPYRNEALKIAGELPVPILKRIFSLPVKTDRTLWDDILSKMRENCWVRPEILCTGESYEYRPVVRIAGGFTGFGGPFERPPAIFSDDANILATDGNRTFRLYADLFGQMLVPEGVCSDSHVDAAGKSVTDGPSLEKNDRILFGESSWDIPDNCPEPSGQAVSTNFTLVYGSTRSHCLTVIGMEGLGR